MLRFSDINNRFESSKHMGKKNSFYLNKITGLVIYLIYVALCFVPDNILKHDKNRKQTKIDKLAEKLLKTANRQQIAHGKI